MDKLRSLILVTLLGLLAGCSGQAVVQPTLPSRATTIQFPPYTALPSAKYTETVLPSPTPTKGLSSNQEKGDYLIYWLQQDKRLFFFDPTNDVHIPILPDVEINTFAVNINDQLVFSITIGNQSDIFLLDYPFWENSPINITNTPETSEYPISWSPDGSYLLLHSDAGQNGKLVVWDGSEFTQIHEMAKATRVQSEVWSQEGMLAFTVLPDRGNDEIYVWTGDPTEPAVSVSQGTSSSDILPTWSPEGDLAFYSNGKIAGGGISITVWKNISVSDGILHGSTFDIVGPEPLEFLSYPSWTNDNELLFYIPSTATLYKWDGRQVATMEIEGDHGYWGEWGPHGYWVSVSPYWYSRLYIHNKSNVTIQELIGISPAWSPEGLLAYCLWTPPTFVVYLWNEANVIPIIEYRGYIWAMWRNGNRIICSMG